VGCDRGGTGCSSSNTAWQILGRRGQFIVKKGVRRWFVARRDAMWTRREHPEAAKLNPVSEGEEGLEMATPATKCVPAIPSSSVGPVPTRSTGSTVAVRFHDGARYPIC